MKHIIFILLLSIGAAAHADSKRKVYRKTQSVDFDATDVDGVARSPDGAYVSQQKGIKFLPLYKVNQNFDRAIKKSVQYVR